MATRDVYDLSWGDGQRVTEGVDTILAPKYGDRQKVSMLLDHINNMKQVIEKIHVQADELLTHKLAVEKEMKKAKAALKKLGITVE